jgi:Natural resistance-associated macrophage protein
MLVFAVAAVKSGPDWAEVGKGFVPHIAQNNTALYLYFVVGLLGAAMTPYEVYFYSSGGVEEEWRPKDIGMTGRTRSSVTGLAAHCRSRDDRRCDSIPRSRHLAGAPRVNRTRLWRYPRQGRLTGCVGRHSLRSRRSLDRHRVRGRLQPRPVLRMGVGALPPSKGRPALHADMVLLLVFAMGIVM